MDIGFHWHYKLTLGIKSCIGSSRVFGYEHVGIGGVKL